MKNIEGLPNFLRVNRPYESDPELTTLGHTTGTEKDLYSALSEEALALSSSLGRGLRILDVCCASGGASSHILTKVSAAHLTLVDIDPRMCEAARAREWPLRQVEVIEADASLWRSETRFDLILSNSAYHHIPDEQKLLFMRNLGRHLDNSGRILVGEHFLPEYVEGNLISYRSSVTLFYKERITELEEAGDSPEAIEIIRQTGRYCWERSYEYQVCSRIFLADVRKAGLVDAKLKRIWPKREGGILPEDSGTFLAVVSK